MPPICSTWLLSVRMLSGVLLAPGLGGVLCSEDSPRGEGRFHADSSRLGRWGVEKAGPVHSSSHPKAFFLRWAGLMCLLERRQ